MVKNDIVKKLARTERLLHRLHGYDRIGQVTADCDFGMQIKNFLEKMKLIRQNNAISSNSRSRSVAIENLVTLTIK